MGMEENLRNHVFTSGEASLSYLRKNINLKNFIMSVHQEILIYLKTLKIINQIKLMIVNIYFAQVYLMSMIKI